MKPIRTKSSCTVSKKQRGFSLIEVLISTFVITIGLVSLLGAFAMAMATTQTAKQDMIAKQLAQEAMESVVTARETANVTRSRCGNGARDWAGWNRGHRRRSSSNATDRLSAQHNHHEHGKRRPAQYHNHCSVPHSPKPSTYLCSLGNDFAIPVKGSPCIANPKRRVVASLL